MNKTTYDGNKTVSWSEVGWQPTKRDNASKVLLLASEILDKGSHCKGTATGPGNAHCLSGSVTQAILNLGYPLNLYDTALDRIRPFADKYLIQWNDHPERTKAEVVSALRKAAGS